MNLGRISMVSMPSDYVPRRLDWAKWVDCEASSIKVGIDAISSFPRVCMSPDHEEEKDNVAIMSLPSQRDLEHVDPMKILSEVSENTRILFVGSWFRSTPSWAQSVQAIRASQFGDDYPKVLQAQLASWLPISESLSRGANFLVLDDVGRFSALSTLAKSWITRQQKVGASQEVKSKSWFACSIDLLTPVTVGGTSVKLHRLAVINPEDWCGAPFPEEKILAAIKSNLDCKQLWISSPGLGLSLWLAQLRGISVSQLQNVLIPSSMLGWHPLRDAMAFLAEAPSRSILLLVDRHSRLQVLYKEIEEPKL
jgi:hypothetical protein